MLAHPQALLAPGAGASNPARRRTVERRPSAPMRKPKVSRDTWAAAVAGWCDMDRSSILLQCHESGVRT